MWPRWSEVIGGGFRYNHVVAALVAVSPVLLVARKTTWLPLGAFMLLAHVPQEVAERVTHGPALTRASTPASVPPLG